MSRAVFVLDVLDLVGRGYQILLYLPLFVCQAV